MASRNKAVGVSAEVYKKLVLLKSEFEKETGKVMSFSKVIELLLDKFELDEYAVLYHWFPPRCPNCGGILSQKMYSDKLVCLLCRREYSLR